MARERRFAAIAFYITLRNYLVIACFQLFRNIWFKGASFSSLSIHCYGSSPQCLVHQPYRRHRTETIQRATLIHGRRMWKICHHIFPSPHHRKCRMQWLPWWHPWHLGQTHTKIAKSFSKVNSGRRCSSVSITAQFLFFIFSWGPGNWPVPFLQQIPLTKIGIVVTVSSADLILLRHRLGGNTQSVNPSHTTAHPAIAIPCPTECHAMSEAYGSTVEDKRCGGPDFSVPPTRTTTGVVGPNLKCLIRLEWRFQIDWHTSN